MGTICEGFTEKVMSGRSVIGNRSNQEGNRWMENIPDRRKVKCKSPEVGTCPMVLSYSKKTNVARAEWSREGVTRDGCREGVGRDTFVT